MFRKAGGNGRIVVAAVALALVAITFVPMANSTANGGTHQGYRDRFLVDTPSLPTNYRVVAGGPDTVNNWRVESGALMPVNVAGTSINLVDPNVPIDLIGNRLVSLCIVPEQTFNSLFYSGFTVNVANLVDVNLGHGTDLTIRLNIPQAVVQLLDQAGNIISQVPLPVNVPFNVATCLSIKVDALKGDLLVVLGQALNDIGDVVNGVPAAPLHTNLPIPSGTVGFTQPASNTGRILFSNLWVMATPDVPRTTQTYAGPGNGQVTLSWDAPALDGGRYVTQYNVYRGTSPADLRLVETVPGFNTQFIDTPYTGLVPTTQKFYYAVSAINDVGEGPAPGPVCAVPYPLGLLPLDGTGLGCGDHGLVESPVLSKLLG